MLLYTDPKDGSVYNLTATYYPSMSKEEEVKILDDSSCAMCGKTELVMKKTVTMLNRSAIKVVCNLDGLFL